MEGIPILAVVDTAAQVSVINAKLAKKWALKKAEAHSIEKALGINLSGQKSLPT